MEISSSILASRQTNVSILKSANHQPELAGELISKTIESLVDIQATQTVHQPATASPLQSIIGQLINTIA